MDPIPRCKFLHCKVSHTGALTKYSQRLRWAPSYTHSHTHMHTQLLGFNLWAAPYEIRLLQLRLLRADVRREATVKSSSLHQQTLINNSAINSHVIEEAWKGHLYSLGHWEHLQGRPFCYFKIRDPGVLKNLSSSETGKVTNTWSPRNKYNPCMPSVYGPHRACKIW